MQITNLQVNVMDSLERVFGRIVGYARGTNTQYVNYVLIHVDGVDSKLVDKLIGHRVKVVDNHGNTYIGKILRRHSRRRPIVVARFKPNIPGQLIGASVVIE